VRRRIEALCSAGVHVFVVSGTHVGPVDGQLGARTDGPGRLHLCVNRGPEVFEVGRRGPVLRARRPATDVDEIGLTDKSDAARWAARWLAERGITGGLILLAGDEFGPLGAVPGSDSLMLVPELARAVAVSVGVEPEGVPPGVLHLPGGPPQFLELLDVQLARRRDRRVPAIDDDPAWIVALPPEHAMKRAAEAVGTLANGWVGIRASREEDGAGTALSFTVNGIYTGEPEPRLLPGPAWHAMSVRVDAGDERLVDLRTGVLLRAGRAPSQLRTLRFVSAARREAMALRAEATTNELDPSGVLAAPVDGAGVEREERGNVHLARTGDPTSGGITVAARDWNVVTDDRRVVERLAAWAADPGRLPQWDAAAARLDDIEQLGFDRLLADHREAWARRWVDAAVTIEGSPDDELAARFATFHLLGAAPDDGEAAVGARGLTGTAYGGHVFWDADVFVLPALAATRPAAARAMLEYRVRRLPAARDAAAAAGRRGARFPWESAGDGRDVTPRRARGHHGETILIRTGEHEEHIVAGVAWAASEYAAWTGDVAFLAGPGRDLILDTARYWANRIRLDRHGRAHLEGVMGPDEYHELVDDNTYTNVMARWNLRRAAQLVDRFGGEHHERDDWQRLADALVDGWDPARGVYEQFAGYWDLEPMLVENVAEPPIAADVLLGADRVTGSQIIKQADVLMLHHLVPNEVVPGSLAANLAFYEPRTAHGSSLSPAIHAALFARNRQPERALELFRIAARLDLDDLTGTTAGGLHLATMGGVWQALAYGFLGLRPRGAMFEIDPCLPGAWQALTVRFRLGGQPVAVRADHTSVTVTCAQQLQVGIAGGSPQSCEPPESSFPLEGSTR
jgi:trehalose/maltose hydrolase-like predicted phosphorylase